MSSECERPTACASSRSGCSGAPIPHLPSFGIKTSENEPQAAGSITLTRTAFASQSSRRFSGLRFGRESWKSSSELGSCYKAAMVKTMTFWAADFLKQDKGNDELGNLRAFTMHALAEFQLPLDIGGPFFSTSDKHEVISYARQRPLLSQQFAVYDRERRDKGRFYKITRKFHIFAELTFYICIDETNRNPRCLSYTSNHFWIHVSSQPFLSEPPKKMKNKYFV